MADNTGRITLWGVEVFIATAEERSITAAARRLGASPSAVSQQLTNLEGAMGVTLLQRNARPILLTPAGEIFRRRAQNIMNEAEQVLGLFREHYGIKLVHVDAAEMFLSGLAGLTDPEKKRKFIGGAFIDLFEEEARKIGGADFLAQGTLYPDVIESVSFTGGPSVTIKSHHNVGGLPERMNMQLVEPLRELFKDEVRDLGRELGLPEIFVGRHPFPGPGLAIRIPGEVTKERCDILRKADAIYLEEIRNAGLYDAIWQAFAVLLPVKTVGVMGDARTYDSVCGLRAVTSTDGMTADVYPFDATFLTRVSTRIVNEVNGVNRVVYDYTSKPPGTIEWE